LYSADCRADEETGRCGGAPVYDCQTAQPCGDIATTRFPETAGNPLGATFPVKCDLAEVLSFAPLRADSVTFPHLTIMASFRRSMILRTAGVSMTQARPSPPDLPRTARRLWLSRGVMHVQ
jgi:hypothetical protein